MGVHVRSLEIIKVKVQLWCALNKKTITVQTYKLAFMSAVCMLVMCVPVTETD